MTESPEPIYQSFDGERSSPIKSKIMRSVWGRRFSVLVEPPKNVANLGFSHQLPTGLPILKTDLFPIV